MKLYIVIDKINLIRKEGICYFFTVCYFADFFDLGILYFYERKCSNYLYKKYNFDF